MINNAGYNRGLLNDQQICDCQDDDYDDYDDDDED